MHSFLCKRSVVTLGLLAAALGALTPQAADAAPTASGCLPGPSGP
jgi:hypothetical protein